MIPVYCEHCGAMFSSRMFNFGPNARVASMHLEGIRKLALTAVKWRPLLMGSLRCLVTS
jgi:hypothetical protein